jgi:hypothetical protein
VENFLWCLPCSGSGVCLPKMPCRGESQNLAAYGIGWRGDTPQFFNPARGDLILNPLDERCPYWSPCDEVIHEGEALTLATSLFPDKPHENTFFISQQARLVPLRVWFRWMTRQNHILHNPASEIDLPRLGRTLPKNILSVPEIEQVMLQPNLADPLGLRDRAILEVIYATGLRRLEIVNLKLFDLQLDRGLIVVRQGKGKKDRYVPIGERATAWLKKYIAEARPQLALEPDDLTVFLTAEGEPFSRDHLTWTVRVHIVAAKIGKLEYIEATKEDVKLARELVRQVLAPSLDELPAHTRRLLVRIEKMAQEECERLQVESDEYRFTRRTVRQYTRWGDTQLRLHLRRLEEMEYLIVRRGGPGQTFVYQLRFDYDDNRAGLEGNCAGGARVPRGGAKSEESPATMLVNATTARDSENTYREIEAANLEHPVIPPSKPNGRAHATAGGD